MSATRRYIRLVGAARDRARQVAVEVYRAGASLRETAAELAERDAPVSHATVAVLLAEAQEPVRDRNDPARQRRAALARWERRSVDEENA